MANTRQLRKNLLQASKMLNKEGVDSIKYLLKDDIGDGTLEQIISATDLFDLMEKHNIFSTKKNDLTGLVEILDHIERNDIIDVLNSVRKVEKKPMAYKENMKAAKLIKTPDTIADNVVDTVANMIAGDWKRLARYLEIGEDKVEQIDIDCRKTYEKAMKSIATWKQMCYKAATWEDLKRSLEEIPRFDIVRKVEDKFPELLHKKVVTTSNGNDTEGNFVQDGKGNFDSENAEYGIQSSDHFSESDMETTTKKMENTTI